MYSNGKNVQNDKDTAVKATYAHQVVKDHTMIIYQHQKKKKKKKKKKSFMQLIHLLLITHQKRGSPSFGVSDLKVRGTHGFA